MRSSTLYRVLAVLLVLIAAALIANHVGTLHHVELPAAITVVAGGRPTPIFSPERADRQR